MKSLLCLTLFSSFLILVAFSEENTGQLSTDTSVSLPDTSFHQDEAIAAIKKMIEGKEELLSGEVFSNIQVMKDIPAGRLLPIMQFGFSGSLGVNCTHCHNPDEWASDEKEEKQITRDMWTMVGTINRDLLGSIENLKGPQPIINCTTCHRGDIKPATRM
jgi:hypothetical protein